MTLSDAGANYRSSISDHLHHRSRFKQSNPLSGYQGEGIGVLRIREYLVYNLQDLAPDVTASAYFPVSIQTFFVYYSPGVYDVIAKFRGVIVKRVVYLGLISVRYLGLLLKRVKHPSEEFLVLLIWRDLA